MDVFDFDKLTDLRVILTSVVVVIISIIKYFFPKKKKKNDDESDYDHESMIEHERMINSSYKSLLESVHHELDRLQAEIKVLRKTANENVELRKKLEELQRNAPD